MQVDYLIIADAVAIANNKQYIHGAGWDSISTPSFPVAVSIGVAARLRALSRELGQITAIELDIIDSADESILPPQGRPLGRPQHMPGTTFRPDEEQFLPLGFSFPVLVIPQPDTYTVVLRVNEIELARSPFRVLEREVPPVSGEHAPAE